MKSRNGLLWGKYLKPPLWSTIVSLEFGWCISCKKRLTFSMRNPLPTCTSMAATFLSCSIRSHSCATDGKEKRRHDRLSSFLVPAWLHKTMNPVRPYSSWEPQGNSERLYSPLFEFLQSFMLYFLLKTVSGKWVVLFWFHPACCFWGRRPLLREGVQSVSSKTTTACDGVEGIQGTLGTHRMLSVRVFSATFSAHTAQNSRSAFQIQATEVQGL